jgi:hypothetical protein
MRRSLRVAAALLVAWASVGACGGNPPLRQHAALAVVDGHPTAVVAACGRSTVDVAVYRDDNTMEDELHEWSVTVTLPNPVQDVDVELFGAARPGWEIFTDKEKVIGSGPGSFTVIPLTSLEPGHHYRLTARDYGPEGSFAAEVTFTVDDLRKIGDGQVMMVGDQKSLEIVSRESFIHESCAQ